MKGPRDVEMDKENGAASCENSATVGNAFEKFGLVQTQTGEGSDRRKGCAG